MKQYQCQKCDEVFSGEEALEEIQAHLMECAVIEIVEKPFGLTNRLKEKFPFIERTETRIEDYDEPNSLIVYRKDGSKYRVYYPYVHINRNQAFIPFDKSEKPTRIAKSQEEVEFEHISGQIEEKEAYIQKVVDTIHGFKPRSQIKYLDCRENTGYLGDGFKFEFYVKDQKIQQNFFKNEDAIGSIKAYYLEEFSGELTGQNGEYAVGEVSLKKWLELNKGQKVQIKIVE